jgi:hypothetical protein
MWYSEAYCEGDGGRADLEARVPDGPPTAIIEAKLSAPVTAGQLRCYAARLHGRSDEGILVALVPRGRLNYASKIIMEAFGVDGNAPWHSTEYPNVAINVLTWEDVLDALGTIESAEFVRNLESFADMYQVLSGMGFPPLADIEALRAWREREPYFSKLVDRVSRRLSIDQDVNPMAVEPIEQQAVGVEARGYRRRYVCRDLTGAAGARPCFSLGIRDPFVGHDTPIWLRFNRTTQGFAVVRDRLGASPFRTNWVIANGHIWIPLIPEFGIQDQELVNDVISKAEAVLHVVFR